ncbi:MAG TPA: putative porin [Burkholderiales bacterium]|nr:putative porin [Burkholderiales bacterium]
MGFTTTAYKRLILAAALTGLFGASAAPAFADMETLLDKLHEKGVLSDDDYQQMRTEARADRRTEALKNATQEEKEQKAKSSSASALKVPEALKSMELYGDLRLRYENRIARAASDTATSEERQRWRYALRVGLRGDVSDDFFYGLRLDTGTYGRSAWVTMADDNNNNASKSSQSNKTSDAVAVGLAFIGWKPADWVQVIAGRQTNPLFTSSMVWDPDITPEGLSEKFVYKLDDNATLFATAGQYLYSQIGKRTGAWTGATLNSPNPGLGSSESAMLYATEVGGAYKFSETTAARAAVNYYKYRLTADETVFNSNFQGTGGSVNDLGIRNLQIVEIPMELRFPVASLSGAVFGEYAWNIDGKKRAALSATPQFDGDNKAMMIGLSLASSGVPQSLNQGPTLGSSAKKGTWEVRTYYQRIEQFALDQNMIDSDFFERTNIAGYFVAGAYSPANGIITTLRYGNAKRLNDNMGTGGFNDDSSNVATINKYQLIQADLTLRF